MQNNSDFQRLGRLAKLYFPNKKVVATDNSLKIIRPDGRSIEIFRDPYGGDGDQALSLFDVRVCATDELVIAQTNGQRLTQEQLHELIQARKSHQFVLMAQNKEQRKEYFIGSDLQCPTATAVGIIEVTTQENETDDRVINDYVTKLNVFMNNDWWGWRNGEETVSGYESFAAALTDAEF